MDFFTLSPSDWHVLALASGVPDTVWAALVSAIVTLALATLLLSPRQRGGRAAAGVPGSDGAACDFLLSGGRIRPMTAPARALLAEFGGETGTPLQALTRHITRDCTTLETDLEALARAGAAFCRRCAGPDGSIHEVSGRPRGGSALLSIRPASEEARALDAAERGLERARADCAFQGEALDRAPILAWSLAPDGTITWANAAYRERFAAADGRPLAVFAHAVEEVPLTSRDGFKIRSRVMVADPRGGEPHWFELSNTPLASGETLAYAIEADDVVAAEASLRRFIETLTETFAHLPIGLAVFDKNRRLGLHNPALSELLKTDAVWLAGRPSLRDFLERLRETRQMPEQKDFAAFRRMLTELEESAREGSYEETWQLPSGKIFRVSGRPHPQGALAFLFEDISPTIQLERRYRSELELSQATLDRIGEAVAVFDTSGMLVFVNAAFERLWSVDPMESLAGPDVGEMVELWESRCAPSPAWADLAAFATGAETRTVWTAPIETLCGEVLELQVAPMPNGSTLVTFRARPGCAPSDMPTGARASAEVSAGIAAAARLGEAALLNARALDELERPAEVALRSLGPAIGAAPGQAAFAALSTAAQALKDGLARAHTLQQEAEAALAGTEALMVDDRPSAARLAKRLEGLLALRGLTVTPPAPALPEPASDNGTTLVLAPLAIAMAATAAKDTPIEITQALHAAPPEAATAEPAELAVARPRLAALGARLESDHGADRVSLKARPPDAAPSLRAAIG